MKNASLVWWLGGAIVLIVVGVVVVMSGKEETSFALKPLVQNEPFTVTVEFEGGLAEAGRTQHVHVQVAQNGQPFDVYNSGYALHLIAANSDFSTFLHTVDLHEDKLGVYGADVSFGLPGTHRVWVEVNDARGEQHHGKEAPSIGYTDVRVRGQANGALPQPRVYAKEAQTGPYRVKLNHQSLRAGTESEIRLTVQDVQGNIRQLTDPEPNIYVMVGPKGDASFPFFRHGHSEPATGGNTVVWRETFPQPGEYLLWTTVYLGSPGQPLEAVEVPFVLTVT